MRKDSKIWYLIFLNLVLVVVAWWFTLSHYSNLPDEIPTHFGFSRPPDEWGAKGTVFSQVGVQAGIYLLFLGLIATPSARNDSLPRFARNDFLGKEKVEKLPEEARKIALGEWEGLNGGIFALLIACIVIADLKVCATHLLLCGFICIAWMFWKINQSVESQERR